jgi:hypothetical protein
VVGETGGLVARGSTALNSILRRRLLYQQHPSEDGTIEKVLRTFTQKLEPESGSDCLICADFARHVVGETAGLVASGSTALNNILHSSI